MQTQERPRLATQVRPKTALPYGCHQFLSPCHDGKEVQWLSEEGLTNTMQGVPHVTSSETLQSNLLRH